MDFGSRLYELMKEHNITQSQLAKNIDVSQRAVSLWVNHQSEPTESSIVKCARYFSVTADYILGLTDDY